MKKLWASVVVLAVALVVFPGCSKKSASGSSANAASGHDALEMLASRNPDPKFDVAFWAEEGRKARQHADAGTPVAAWTDTLWDEGIQTCRTLNLGDSPNCALHFGSTIRSSDALSAAPVTDPLSALYSYRFSFGTEPPPHRISAMKDAVPNYLWALRLANGEAPPADLLVALENAFGPLSPAAQEALVRKQ